jgi:hypothetical protein
MFAALASLALAAACGSTPERVNGAAQPAGAQPASTVTTTPASVAPTSAAPTSAAPTASSPAVTPTVTAPRLVLGPKGLGALKLGMTRAQAEATKLVEKTGPNKGDCTTNYRLKAAGADVKGTDDDAIVWYSAKLGITTIIAYPGLATPEGIKLGSSRKAVKAAYPDWRNITGPEPDGLGLAKAPGNSKAQYEITTDDKGKVIHLQLELIAQYCYR